MKRNLLLMTQAEIAEASGLSQQYISKIINGDRQPSLEAAESLETATGMCRESWLWPDRHWSPYVPFSRKNSCVACTNRTGRVKWTVNRCMKYLSEAEDKVDALRDCLEAMLYHNGYDDTVALAVRHRIGDAYHKVAATKTMLPDIMPCRLIPWGSEQLQNGKVIHFANVLDAPDVLDRMTMIATGITSILLVPSGDHFFAMTTYRGHTARWTDKTIDQAKRWIGCIAKNLSGPHQ